MAENLNITIDSFDEFCKKAESYGVCDKIKIGGAHKRIRMGIDDKAKARFLGCARKDRIRLYFNERDTWIVERIGCFVEQSSDKSYSRVCDLYPEKYDVFLGALQTTLGRNGNDAYIDINTPLSPKSVFEDTDGTIRFKCGLCGKGFLKAPRCPECGQLVKE